MTQQEIMNYRADFPLLRESKVAYLDNAATSQRPASIITGAGFSSLSPRIYRVRSGVPGRLLMIIFRCS